MKRSLYFLLLLVISVPSCLEVPDPPRENIRAHVILYNFLNESYSLSWDVDHVTVPDDHMYGTIVSGSVILTEDTNEISFVVRNRSTNEVLADLLYDLTGEKFYMIILYGAGDDPHIIFEELETDPPESGYIKQWFLHAAQGYDTLDIYMGGTTPDKQVLSGIAYQDLTDYSTVLESDARTLVAVTLHDSVYREENELIYYEYNDLVKPNSIYLNVIAPSTHLPHSDLDIWLYEQPVNLGL